MVNDPASSIPRQARPRNRSAIALALTTLAAATVGSLPVAQAYESSHQRVDLIWNVDAADCTAAAMSLVGDGLWSVAVALPTTSGSGDAEVRFLFMVEGSMQPSCYGQDILTVGGVVFGPNPPNMVVDVAAPGYTVFTLDENALSYSALAAPGLIRATLTYTNTATPVPGPVLSGTRAAVYDLTAGVDLGAYGGADAQALLAIGGLLPGHTYTVAFSAPGYLAATVTETVPDATPREIAVTLNKLVPNVAETWSALKNHYR